MWWYSAESTAPAASAEKLTPSFPQLEARPLFPNGPEWSTSGKSAWRMFSCVVRA